MGSIFSTCSLLPCSHRCFVNDEGGHFLGHFSTMKYLPTHHASFPRSHQSASAFAMSSSSTTFSAGSSSPVHPWKYDVFLSFKGEDTRKNFTDHLHAALERHGIITFIDDKLNRGEQVSSALLQVVEESRFSIIILSQNYASSSWCLDELTKIVECVKVGRHTAIPVFYNVDPSHVRKQIGCYAQAFEMHEEASKDNMEKVLKWREALTEASKISGWDTRDRPESKVVKEIVLHIVKKVSAVSLSDKKALVGMDSRASEVLSLLSVGSNDVRMLGIWGMPGIGKTTIANFVYRKIHTQFEAHCFVPSVGEKYKRKENIEKEILSQIVGENNLISFEKVISSKKVLLVLDDVDHHQQLDDLVGNHIQFARGSRIIITTRNKHVLREKDFEEYPVEELEQDDAWTLFCQHAFKDKLPMEGFEELSHRALAYTRGVPLALEILGRFLYKRSKKEWGNELKKLKKIPKEGVQKVFRISFDGLDDDEKNLFLDIACFFRFKDKGYVTKILKSCFFPQIGISILEEKALITISDDDKLDMHSLIQEMGWEIVRQESIKYPGKRSRLWVSEDVKHVLTTNTVTEAIEGMVFDLSALDELHLSCDVFTKMNQLRILRFYNACKLHLAGDFKFLSNKLRSLCWHGYPLESLPSNFEAENLVELNLTSSRLEHLWEANKSFPELRFIDLSHSQHLIRIPDLSGSPKLKKINLENCTSLVKVHSSIGALEKLSMLKLEGCSKLKKLPKSIGKLTSLQALDLSGCSELKKLAEDMGMSLRSLNLSGCSQLEELPRSICKLTSLQTLNLSSCSELKKLPDDLGTSLQNLDLSHCSKLNKLPNDMGSLQSLINLVADGSGIQELPLSINLLTKLKVISLAGCKGGESLSSSSPRQGLKLPPMVCLSSLQKLILSDCNLPEGALPTDLSTLRSLQSLDLSRNYFNTLPSLTELTKLHMLKLESCSSLQSLTGLPSSISEVLAQNCESLETFSHPPNSYAKRESGKLLFDFSNCQKLLKNEQSVSLEAILQGIRVAAPSPASRSLFKRHGFSNYNAIVAGNSIPEWFIHQSMGNSLTVKLLQEYDDTRSMGLAFVAVLGGKHEKTTRFGHSEYFSRNEFVNFSEYDLALGVPMHSSEYDHIWFGYAPLPQILDHEDCGDYRASLVGGLDDEGESDYPGYYMHPSINHIKVSFNIRYDRGAPVVKMCGIRLLHEPDWKKEMMNQLHNGEIIEYDSVAAISCPSRTMFFEEERCWKEDVHVGNTSARFGLQIEVRGYHKNVIQEAGKRLAPVAISVPAALKKRKLAEAPAPHPVQAHRMEEVQHVLKQHPSFLVTEPGMSNGANMSPPLARCTSIETSHGAEKTLSVPTMQAEMQHGLVFDHSSELVKALMGELSGLQLELARCQFELDFISRDHTRLKEELDLAQGFATSLQKEDDERVGQLTKDKEALQAQVEQLLAERNALTNKHDKNLN